MWVAQKSLRVQPLVSLGSGYGVKLDQNLNLKSHISKVRQSAFYTISNLGRIKNILSRDLRIMLVKQLVLSKVDYHNALYANIPDIDILNAFKEWLMLE